MHKTSLTILVIVNFAMTHIKFYSLQPNSHGNYLQLACRLVERICADHLRILVYCPDSEQAQLFDRLLWTFHQDSFLPHGLVGSVDPQWTPVLISSDGQPETEQQVLLNLSLEIPVFFERFERVCELIDHSPERIATGRERFRQYRERGFPLEHHSIRL